MPAKVCAYITHGEKLLVFRHPDFPEAGIQVVNKIDFIIAAKKLDCKIKVMVELIECSLVKRYV